MAVKDLTVFPSDMLFGVGLGCLVQMLTTKSDVQVISSNTHISRVYHCGQMYREIANTLSLSPPPPQFEEAGLLTWILAGALGLSLVLSFIFVPLSRFHLGRAYGIFLIIFYCIFLLIALLTEFGTIH